MNFRTPSALSLVSLALASSDAAINPVGGTWTNVTVVSETACTAARCPPHGWVTFKLSANATGNPPECSRYNRDQVAIAAEKDAGYVAVSMLSMARVVGENVTIIGTGACSVDAVIETAGTVTSSQQVPRANIHTGPPSQ